MNIEEVREYCLTLPYVTEDEFCPEVITFRIEGKWFLMMWLEAPEPRVAVKCDPVLAIELRERYHGVEPAYHMNKKMWNDLYLERDLDEEEIRKWIRHSYEDVAKKLPKMVQTRTLSTTLDSFIQNLLKSLLARQVTGLSSMLHLSQSIY